MMTGLRARCGCIAAWALVAATAACGQEQPQPAPVEPPAAGEPAKVPSVKPDESDVERAIKDLERATHKPAAIAPTSIGGVPYTAKSRPSSSVLLREGTFLLNRRGHVGGTAGSPIFVFDPDAQGLVDPPMPLLPCEFLSSMQSIASRAGSNAAYIVSGQTMVYRGRNYLLLTRPVEVVRVAPAASPTPEPAKPATPPAPAASPDTTQPTPANAAQKTIADMEAASPPPPPLPPPAAIELAAAPAPGDRPRLASAYREGTFIASRRARLSRGMGGALAAVFDADTNAPADAPLLIMPCANLMALEDLAARGGDAVSINISGQVYTHNGQSFLLPTMYVIQSRAGR